MKGCYVDTVKCAIITGAASQGIGFAEARRFLEAGWNVVSIDKDEAKFSARMGELPVELRERMEYVRGDVSCEADCRRLVEAVCRKRGRIDALVNNAGIMGWLAPSLEVEFDEVRRVFETDVMGSLQMAVLAGRVMEEQGSGVIVNTGSIAGQLAGAGSLGYSMAKASIDMLTQFLAKDVARHGVRVVSVNPGYVETDLTRRTLALPGMRESAAQLHASKRIMQPDAVADVVYFLCTDAARAINGTCVYADDGYTAFKEGSRIIV